jgi:hypothetical protein
MTAKKVKKKEDSLEAGTDYKDPETKKLLNTGT